MLAIDFTVTFIKIFLWGIYLMSPILIMMTLIVSAMGYVVGRIEGWTKLNSFYWAFITALTIGYGDIRPLKKASKIISIFLGSQGIMLTGILVAITVEASSGTFEIHVDSEQIQKIEKSIGANP